MFEVAADQPRYCVVQSRAIGSIEEDRGTESLERMLVRYLSEADNELALQLLSRKQTEVAIRLKPQSCHTWNFRDRMAKSLVDDIRKICPN